MERTKIGLASLSLALFVGGLLWWAVRPAGRAGDALETSATRPGTAQPPAGEASAEADPPQDEHTAVRMFVEHLERMMEDADAPAPEDEMRLPVPEHLRDASEEEQRAYLVELLHHGEGMLEVERERLASSEAEVAGRPAAEADVASRQRELERGKKALARLRARLGMDTPDAGP